MSATDSFRKFTSIQEDMFYRAKRTQQQCSLEVDRGIISKKRIKNSVLESSVLLPIFVIKSGILRTKVILAF